MVEKVVSGKLPFGSISFRIDKIRYLNLVAEHFFGDQCKTNPSRLSNAGTKSATKSVTLTPSPGKVANSVDFKSAYNPE